MKTTTITLTTIKNHGWDEVSQDLELSEAVAEEYFEYGEYASVELVIDEKLNIIGGRVLPLKIT